MAQQAERLIGDTVYDPSGDKIGKVKRVYVDNTSGQPTWAAVSTGLFSEDSLVPLSGASMRGDKADELQVRVRKDAVKSAPHMEREGLITPEAEDELFVHYGIDPRHAGWEDYDTTTAGRTGTAAQGRTAGQGERRGQQRMGEHMDTADDTSSMVRSEEQLDVGTEQRPTGKARLRKYVVTEEQTVAVPTTHEEVRIEREPITDPSAAQTGMGEEEREVTLHEERPTVSKEQVPVEKVRMAVDEVPGEENVSETVRKERIDTEGTEREKRRR